MKLTINYDPDIPILKLGCGNMWQGECRRLFKAYYKFLVKLGQKWNLSKLDAEEAADDILMKVILKIDKYSVLERTSFNAWILTIAINTIKDYLRVKLNSVIIYTDNLPDNLIDDIAVTAELRKELVCELVDNSNKYRTILLKHVDGWEIKDIATFWGKTQGSIRTQLYRESKQLQNQVKLLLNEIDD